MKMHNVHGRFALAAGFLLLSPTLMGSEVARGTVFHDLNENGIRDDNDPPIAGVPVSNGLDVVLTDEDGRWALPVEDDAVIFMTKPSGYAVETNRLRTPQFFYIHRPEGSPELRYAGLEPTGPLPESIDFPLRRIDEPEDFRVVFFADPQPRARHQFDYVLRTLIGEVRDTANADYGITLGDIAHDDLDFFPEYIKGTAEIGIPFYGVIGNHDLNFDSPGDAGSGESPVSPDVYAGETFLRYFGPRTYSFNIGKVHFVCMDNIIYEGQWRAREAFRERDLEWLRRDLEHVPDDYLVVLATHAPIWRAVPSGRDSDFAVGTEMLFEVLEGRERVLAVNGHTHYTSHALFGPGDGWEGEGLFHQINTAAVSGSGWSGPPGLDGIPMAFQQDGSPQGYLLVDFEGNEYSPRFKVMGRPADYQMRIYPPEAVDGDGRHTHAFVVNVFDGMMGGDAEVRFRLNHGEEREMAFTPQVDPAAKAIYHEDAGYRVTHPHISFRTWEAPLNDGDLAVGTNFVEVVYTDVLGREYRDSMAFFHDSP